MKNRIILLVFLPFWVNAQKDSTFTKHQNELRVSLPLTSRYFLFEGLIRDFNVNKKGEITFETIITTNFVNQVIIGLKKNLEFNAGVINNSGDDKILVFAEPFAGLTFNHEVTRSVLLGSNLQIGYDRSRNIFTSSLSIGGQYRANRSNFGSSIFIQLGKNKVYENVSINSINFWGVYNIVKKGNIGFIGIKTFNPKFYSSPTIWPKYLAPCYYLYYEFLFKTIKLDFGVQYRNNLEQADYFENNQHEFYPLLKLNIRLKK